MQQIKDLITLPSGGFSFNPLLKALLFFLYAKANSTITAYLIDNQYIYTLVSGTGGTTLKTPLL